MNILVLGDLVGLSEEKRLKKSWKDYKRLSN